MGNIGERISEYRKSAGLTQKELGDMLNLTAQAVSKWEKGQTEPDTSTIAKICEIFKISSDELLGVKPQEQEAAVAAAPAPQVIERTLVEQKIISGYCERCKKPVGPDEYVVIGGSRGGTQHIYCKKCKAELDASERRYAYSEHKRQTLKSLIWGPVAGIAMFCLVLFPMVYAGKAPYGFAAPFAVVFGIGYFAFVMQMFWDGVINDMFFFFLKSFRMPGVIFTLDLDGLIFLLLVKVGGAILGAILSVLFFLIGLIVMPIAGIIILPFAAIKRGFETRKLKAHAE